MLEDIGFDEHNLDSWSIIYAPRQLVLTKASVNLYCKPDGEPHKNIKNNFCLFTFTTHNKAPTVFTTLPRLFFDYYLISS